jgi:hypothetical protein
MSTPGISRSCGTCTLCCKVFDVPAVEKVRAVWCRHCTPGKGCGIWQTRPGFCRDFHCLWIHDHNLGPEWKPEKAKFVMNYRRDLSVLNVMVDTSQPDAWRREPYFSGLKRIAGNLSNFRHILQVTIGHRIIVLSPEREFDMGRTEEDLEHVWRITNDATGKERYTLIEVRIKPGAASQASSSATAS